MTFDYSGLEIGVVALTFLLGFIAGRKDTRDIDLSLGLANFWTGFDMGYKTRIEEEEEERLDNDEHL